VSLRAIALHGIVNGAYKGWVYRRLEDANDGTIDLKLLDDNEAKDMIRIRYMREVSFDRKWDRLALNEKFEVTREIAKHRR
jgi:hypothetical protein